MSSDIGAVIGWKFDHQPGMETHEGEITLFPGGIPSQEDQDIWTAEYDLFVAKDGVIAQIYALRDDKMYAGKLNSTVNQTFRTTNLDGGYAQSARYRSGQSSEGSVRNISDITLGVTTTVRVNGNQFSEGDGCYIESVSGTVELNETASQIISVSGNDITIDVDSTNYTPYTSGGTAQLGGSLFDIDGVSFGMTAANLDIVADDISATANLLMRNARRLINEVTELTTVAAVNSFNIDQGWPS